MSKKVILIIDDDALFLMLTRKLLNDQPYLERIDTASSVQEVGQYFQGLIEKGSPLPDAVFIDLDMPQMDGLEMAQQLTNNYLQSRPSAGGPSAGRPATKLYILSSSISQRDRLTAASLGAVHDYMEKPLTANMLKQALGIQSTLPEDRTPLAGEKQPNIEDSSKRKLS